MDEIRSNKQDKCRRRNKPTAICRETGDHVHYPPTRLPKSTRPRDAPSPILDSSFRVTRNSRYDGCGEFVIATAGEYSLNSAACDFHREETLSDGVREVLKLSSYQFRQIFCSPYGESKKRIVIERSGGEDLVVEEEEGRVKRLRTKFTAEQTEKMRNYADKLRWKVSPESREEVEEFCMEIGVNRKKFMDWMNNHKEKVR